MEALNIASKLIPHRKLENNGAAIVLIHGFSGDAAETWGRFPALLASDQRINSWDIYCLGYSSRLSIDLVGLWSADPELDKIALYLRTDMRHSDLAQYKALALIAHSMGGLVVQRALLDDKDLRARVSHVFLFGTPSNGLAKASFLTFLKRQVRDMAHDSPFIKGLREQWRQQFSAKLGKSLPFKFLAVAGDRDEFVPGVSSIGPFPQDDYPEAVAVVLGNHLQIVKPESANDLSVQLVVSGLVGQAAPSGPRSSADVAIESRDFQRAVELLEPHRDELDDTAFAKLVLALENIGRQQDAIRLLEQQKRKSTDVMGVLAGRLKRRWLVERRAADAERARELYATAFQTAEAANDSEQAYYHGINVAFMDLAYGKDLNATREMARKVLAHCANAAAKTQTSENKRWRLATEGQAHLLLGETEAALQSYHEAVQLKPKPRELASTYEQTVLVTGLVGDEELAKRLETIFRGGGV